ncbi:MAG: HAD-IA family hydrolase [Clostridia bacterium]|nr:HAD-IA family hydrolase [Clostridia bacterium]
MIEHFIYDFDGTIVDSYHLFVRFCHEIAENHSITIPCDDNTLYRALKKTAYDGYLVLECEDRLDYQSFLDEFHALQEKYRFEFQPFPEIKDLLQLAVAHGKKNYIYTHTGSVVADMLENIGLLRYFTFILDSSYGFPLKPAPDALLFFLKKFQLDPKTCVMIGDRPLDAHAGMNAGMYGCLWDGESLFTDAKVDFYAKELSQIPKLLQM